MLILGIDEAGRGPVIGSMVMCAAVIEHDKQNQLLELGVKDSKLLRPKQREELEKILPSLVQFKLSVVSPQEIDGAVFSESTNLNWLEADKTVELIKHFNPQLAIIDCPSRNPNAYKNYLAERLPDNIELRPEHKADLNHPIVAAASILAKVHRDKLIQEIKDRIDADCGSGYPGDPKTKAFLQEFWGTYPSIFRKSWAPYKRVSQLS